MTTSIATTRRAWHAVAELVLAGPQFRHSATIRLRVVPGGFATVAQPLLRVAGSDLLVAADADPDSATVAVPLHGLSCRDLALAAGLDVGPPAGLYHDGTGVDPDEILYVSPDAANALGDALAVGDAALRRFAPEAEPVLWPEHFDVGITVGEVNYGLSPGDGYLDEPYAYVGPWQTREGAFWNAPFGAAQPLSKLSDVDGVVAFFTEGHQLAAVSAEPPAS